MAGIVTASNYRLKIHKPGEPSLYSLSDKFTINIREKENDSGEAHFVARFGPEKLLNMLQDWRDMKGQENNQSNILLEAALYWDP